MRVSLRALPRPAVSPSLWKRGDPARGRGRRLSGRTRVAAFSRVGAPLSTTRSPLAAPTRPAGRHAVGGRIRFQSRAPLATASQPTSPICAGSCSPTSGPTTINYEYTQLSTIEHPSKVMLSPPRKGHALRNQPVQEFGGTPERGLTRTAVAAEDGVEGSRAASALCCV